MINKHLPEATLPEQFKIEIQLMPQAIQFNMLTDDQVGLLAEITQEWVSKIQALVATTGKVEHKQLISYPGASFIDRERAIVTINIQYRADADFFGNRVTVK